MRITATDLQQLGIVDRIVPEPVGGAHRTPGEAVESLGQALVDELEALSPLSRDQLRSDRRAKYMAIG